MKEEVIENAPEEVREFRSSNIVSGELADTIIVTLIDNCDDYAAADALEISVDEWHKMVQKFEEQIRHQVRDIR